MRKNQRNMNKQELVDAVTAVVAEATGRDAKDIKDVKAIVDALFLVMRDTVNSGRGITITNLLAVELKYRPQRQARNPQNGGTVTVDAAYKPTFRVNGAWTALATAVQNSQQADS
ncbi:HU family DNA-binding protein [Sphaerisporangium sp. NPDC004334]